MKKQLITSLFILFLIHFLSAQVTITGTVFLDGEGEAIGANVVVEGDESIGTVTEYDGTFSLLVPHDSVALKISYTGFTTQIISSNQQKSITVILSPDSEVFSEVVVGYNSVRIRGANSIKKRKRKKKNTVSSAIYGNSAGVQISSANGKPGSGARIKIRGVSSINTTQQEPEGTEEYSEIIPNKYISPKKEALSTFSIDVDNAAYSNIRRHIQQMEILPSKDAVRTEEMINYFNYDYPIPTKEHPFSISTELGNAPWNPKHQLLKIGLQGYELQFEQAPINNLVFLIDVSGSMESYNKLSLVKESLSLIISNMRDEDQISIVVYAGAAGLVLPPTKGTHKEVIKKAIKKLSAGRSTAGGQGIKLAYKQAKENFIPNGNNRVILCTDGDFNVGTSSVDGLEKLIEKRRDDDIFITVLGFGMGNYKDNRLETLANKGNGNYGYIDNIREAKKMLVDEVASTLFTIAKDVKIQIQFNPDLVESYRLIGYENRLLDKEDFEDDQKDAGELGAGHSVTALYEIIPKGVKDKDIEKVKKKDINTPDKVLLDPNDIASIRLRYKLPKGKESQLIEERVNTTKQTLSEFSEDFKFISAITAWSLLLRDSEFKGNASIKMVLDLAKNGKGSDPYGYKQEFIDLVKASKKIDFGGTLSAEK